MFLCTTAHLHKSACPRFFTSSVTENVKWKVCRSAFSWVYWMQNHRYDLCQTRNTLFLGRLLMQATGNSVTSSCVCLCRCCNCSSLHQVETDHHTEANAIEQGWNSNKHGESDLKKLGFLIAVSEIPASITTFHRYRSYIRKQNTDIDICTHGLQRQSVGWLVCHFGPDWNLNN